MKKGIAATAIVAGAFFAAGAAADETSVCKDTYEEAQELMKSEGHSTLLKARETLRSCLRASCKEWIVADCSRWLSEVESRIPTIVLSARDTAGRDLMDVRVTSAAGEAIATRLDGRTIETEPGEQLYVFLLPDGTRREVRVIVREGEKAQSVRAVFDAPPMDAGSGTLPPRPEPSAPEEAPSSPLKIVGYGAVGVGAVGLGLGTFFGLRAISEKGSANCDASNACDSGPLGDARSNAELSTVSFIAGGLLLAGGIALVILSPSRSTKAQALLTRSASSLGLVGAW